MIMVDELVRYTQAPKAGAAQHFGNGKPSCHLTTDGPLDELHAFAARLGLQRAWFQAGSIPHYDLTPNKRVAAIRLGAQVVSMRDQARARVSQEQPRCRVTNQGRPCNEPVVALFPTPDWGDVPVCAVHRAAIAARLQDQVQHLARQLAEGVSVNDLTLLPPRT